MRIINTVLIVSLALVSATYATVEVDWFTGSGGDSVYQSDDATLISSNATWIAYWSPSSNSAGFSANSPSGVLNPGMSNEVLGVYQMNDAFTLGLGGINGEISVYNGQTYQAENYSYASNYFVGGYVYAAVFDYDYSSYLASPGEIPVGTWYGLGQMSSMLEDRGNPLNEVADYGNAVVRITTDQQVIPEPSSAIIALFGAVFIGFRRLRRKNRVDAVDVVDIVD